MKESSLAGPPVTTSGEKSEGVNGGETGDEDGEKSLLSLSILSFPILFVSILHVCLCDSVANNANKSGFELGWTAEKIMGATEEQKQILFLIRW